MSTLAVVLLSGHPLERLGKCLWSLSVAARAEPRLVLSIFIGYRDERGERVRALIAAHGLPATAVAYDASLPIPQARDRLLAGAPARDWVLYLDDDVILPPDFFTRFADLRARWPSADLFGGPNLTPRGQSGLARASGALLASRLNFVCRNRYRRGPEGPRASERDFILCALFVRDGARPAFAPHLPVGEELGLLRVLLKKGSECVYAPELAVEHYRRETLGELLIQMEKYGRGRGLILRETELLPALAFALLLAFVVGCAWPCALLLRRALMPTARESTLENRVGLLALLPLAYARGVRRGFFKSAARSRGSEPFQQSLMDPIN